MTGTLKLRRSIRNHIWLLAGLVVYLAAYDRVYRSVAVDVYGYQGFENAPPELHVLASGLLVLAILVLALPRSLSEPSSVAQWIMFLMMWVPILWVDLRSSSPSSLGQHRLQMLVLFAGLAIRWSTRSPTTRRWRFTKSEEVAAFKGPLVAASIVVYLGLLPVVISQIGSASVFDPYETRGAYADVAVSLPFFAAYIVRWLGLVLNPALFVSGLTGRRWGVVSLALVGEIYLFLGSGFRQILLTVPALLLFRVIARSAEARRWPAGSPLLVGAAMGFGFFRMLDATTPGAFYTATFVKRNLMSPGLNTRLWIDYFSEHERLFYSYSFLSGWVDYPYDVAPSVVVARDSYGQSFSLNVNFFGNGYANLGLAGIAVSVLLAAILFRWLDYCHGTARTPYSAFLVVGPMLSLVNGGIHTAILSHGFLVLGVVYLLLPAADRMASSGEASLVGGGTKPTMDVGRTQQPPLLVRSTRSQ